MKLPRVYTEVEGMFYFWRGVRTHGEGGDFNLGSTACVREDQAKHAYKLKLRRLKRLFHAARAARNAEA